MVSVMKKKMKGQGEGNSPFQVILISKNETNLTTASQKWGNAVHEKILLTDAVVRKMQKVKVTIGRPPSIKICHKMAIIIVLMSQHCVRIKFNQGQGSLSGSCCLWGCINPVLT